MNVIVKLVAPLVVLSIGLNARADFVDSIVTIVGEAVITYQQVGSVLIQQDDALRIQSRNEKAEYERLRGKLWGDVLENLTDQKLILHEFGSAGFKIPENIINDYVQDRVRDMFHDDRMEMKKQLDRQGITFEDLKQRLHDQFIVDVMRQKFVPEPIVSPLKVETYYLEHKNDFKVEDEVKLRLIVLNKAGDDTGGVRKRMEEIISQVKDGASFSDMAKSYSEGSQRAEGGATGWQEVSKLNKVLVDGVKNLKAGEYSGVLESPEAYFFVLLEERRAARVKPLSEIRAEIEKTLSAQERNRLWSRWINRLKRKTFIETF
jgi:peptidyl-prolyl cis-trans isomerase SurA